MEKLYATHSGLHQRLWVGTTAILLGNLRRVIAEGGIIESAILNHPIGLYFDITSPIAVNMKRHNPAEINSVSPLV